MEQFCSPHPARVGLHTRMLVVVPRRNWVEPGVQDEALTRCGHTLTACNTCSIRQKTATYPDLRQHAHILEARSDLLLQFIDRLGS